MKAMIRTLIAVGLTAATVSAAQADYRNVRLRALVFCVKTLPRWTSYVEQRACVDQQSEFEFGAAGDMTRGKGVLSYMAECDRLGVAKTEYGTDNVALMVCITEQLIKEWHEGLSVQ